MHKMPHNDFSDRKGVPEGQNDDQLGPSHQGQPRATILAIYGRAVGDRAKLARNYRGFIRKGARLLGHNIIVVPNPP